MIDENRITLINKVIKEKTIVISEVIS